MLGLDTDFAINVDVSGDWLVVGSTGSMHNELQFGVLSGAAYLYERTPQGWQFRQRVIAPVGANSDFFGQAVAIDGDRLLIGAPRMVDVNDPDNTFEAGSAYIYERQADNSWTHQHTFSEEPMMMRGYFGAYIALNGPRVLIGANRGFNRANHVWSSYRAADGQWSNLVEVTPPADDQTVGANFGQTLVIDGDSAVIGSPGGPQNISRVYRYVWENNAWRFVQWLEPDLEDTQDGYDFGAALGFRDDVLVVGAPSDSGPNPVLKADSYGAAFIFTANPPICTIDGACVCQGDADGCTLQNPQCDDEQRNGAESDLDCGGVDCQPCALGLMCQRDTDCASGDCANGRCVVRVRCDDGIRNGDETDIDCGGPLCGQCSAEQACVVNADCLSDECTNGQCASALCAANEYVDCNVCTPCPAGTQNAAGDDRLGANTFCDVTVCNADEVRNQDGACEAITCAGNPDVFNLDPVASQCHGTPLGQDCNLVCLPGFEASQMPVARKTDGWVAHAEKAPVQICPTLKISPL